MFSTFNESLKEIFSEDFSFENDFSDFLYSHTSEVIYVIFLVTLLTSLEIKKMDEESDAKLISIVNTFEEEDKASQLFMNEIFE